MSNKELCNLYYKVVEGVVKFNKYFKDDSWNFVQNIIET